MRKRSVYTNTSRLPYFLWSLTASFMAISYMKSGLCLSYELFSLDSDSVRSLLSFSNIIIINIDETDGRNNQLIKFGLKLQIFFRPYILSGGKVGLVIEKDYKNYLLSL